MQLKTFSAPSLHQALQKAKLALGENGIIVSTSFDTHLGIARVIAGIEQPLWIENTIKHDKKDLLTDIEGCLDFHNVPEGLLLEIMAIVESNLHLKNATDILGKSLESRLCFHHSTELPQIMSLVGLPGAGKTSTAARLALSLKEQTENVTIVSLDHCKAGAYDQVTTYSEAINVKLELPQSPEELESIVHHTSGRIIIDTPGVNPFDEKDRIFLEKWIPDYHKIWVNPVNTSLEDVKDYAKFFHEIGAFQHLITKTDLCKKLGSTVSLLLQDDTKISYWSNDPKINVPLQEGTSYNFAELMMQKYIQSSRNGESHE